MSKAKFMVDAGPPREHQGPVFVDVAGPEAVSIQISSDGKTLWVNIDEQCVLRCCHIERGIRIQDDFSVAMIERREG